MRTRLLALLLLFPSVPASAFQELFDGIDAGWVQAQEAMREHKLQEARNRRAEGPRLKPLGDLVKPNRVPRRDAYCTWRTVGEWLGGDTTNGRVPNVYYASRTLLHDFAAWRYVEHGPSAAAPATITTEYLPAQNAIFMDDEGTAYDAGRTIDDALAGQFALYFRHAAGKAISGPEAAAQTRDIESRFNRSGNCQKR